MAEEEKKISRTRKKHLLKRLKQEMTPKRGILYFSAFLTWLQFLMRLLSFALITATLVRFYQGASVAIFQVSLSLVALNALGFLMALFAKPLQGQVSQYARDCLKAQFFKAFVLKKGDFGDDQTPADIFTIASQGIDSLDTYYSYYLSLDLKTKWNCLTILILVFYLFPWGGVIFLLVLPLIPLSILLMQKRSKRIMNRYWASYMNVGNRFLDDLNGLNTLYAYQADERYEEEFTEQAEDFRDATMELLGFQLQAVGYMDAVMYLGIGVAGFVAISLLALGQLPLFTALYFIFMATEFFTPIREAGYGMHLVMMHTKMADRIFSFLDSVTDDKKKNEKENVKPFSQVCVEGLSFAYDGHLILDKVQFTARKGGIFALSGESGQGKTTLARLLLGDLQATEGTIFYGNQASFRINPASLQDEVLYVSADSYLFNASILENLQLATQLSAEDIQAFIEEKGVLGFVKDLPDGLKTKVGEDGKQLSPGQRQQLLCVRAMLSKRSLYIFDEMTASVDKENEALIYDLLEHLAKEAIVFVITHKMSQVQKAREVLFLEPSKASLGSPETLYQENAGFSYLVDTQKELEDLLDEA